MNLHNLLGVGAIVLAVLLFAVGLLSRAPKIKPADRVFIFEQCPEASVNVLGPYGVEGNRDVFVCVPKGASPRTGRALMLSGSLTIYPDLP
jgi:hypothetical protein